MFKLKVMCNHNLNLKQILSNKMKNLKEKIVEILIKKSR